MRNLLIRMSLLIAVALAACGGAAPKVAQGTVLKFDAEHATMALRDESDPGNILEFSVQGAEIGAVTMPGDTVRVAYREAEGKLRATRVMNITRQAELGIKARK